MDEELKQHLVAMEARLAEGAKAKEQRLEAKLEAKIDASEERLKEFTRGLQTELLRGFEVFSRNQSTRLQK